LQSSVVSGQRGAARASWHNDYGTDDVGIINPAGERRPRVAARNASG
jgi:hypothetical protein